MSGTLACRRGYALAKMLVERRADTGAAWFVIDDLSRMSCSTIESLRLRELTADTEVRLVGASDGFDSANPQSTILLPMLGSMNEAFVHQLKAKVRRGMDDAFRRGRKKVHRVDLDPKVLIRPMCDCCGSPMILGRSAGRYQSFFCFNATSGVKGCTNRGYKSARIIDEAVLGAVMATLFTEGFIADLTADVNARLAELARQPIPSTKELEQEIVNEDRQLKRLTDWLDKIDGTHLDAVIAKAVEMGRQLAAKRERLKELQRAGRRPKVKSVREQDVVALLSHLRDLLQGDVAMAAQVLKALVGDVVIQKQHVDGYENPQMVARFTINAVAAMAVLGRPTATAVSRDDAQKEMWIAFDGVAQQAVTERAATATNDDVVISLEYDRSAAARRAAGIRDGAP